MVEQVYQYLRNIGLEGNQASFYVTKDRNLIPKPVRPLRWLQSLFYSPPDLGAVIQSFRAWKNAHLSESQQTLQKCDFVTACLWHIKEKRDPHLMILAYLNQLRETIHFQHIDKQIVAHAKYLEHLYLTQTTFTHGAMLSSVRGLFRLILPTSSSILPRDILCTILAHLPPNGALQARLVCKIWESVASEVLACRNENRLLLALKPKNCSFIQALVQQQRLMSAHRSKRPLRWQKLADNIGYQSSSLLSWHTFVLWRSPSLLHLVKDASYTTLPAGANESFTFTTHPYSLALQTDGSILLKKWNLQEGEVEKYYFIHLPERVKRWCLCDSSFICRTAKNTLYTVDLSKEPYTPVELGSMPENAIFGTSLNFFYTDEKTKQLAMKDMKEMEQKPKFFPGTELSSYYDSDENIVLLKSPQNNLLVYCKHTQKRLGHYPIFANDDIDQDGSMLYTYRQDEGKLWAIDIRTKEKALVHTYVSGRQILISKGYAYALVQDEQHQDRTNLMIAKLDPTSS